MAAPPGFVAALSQYADIQGIAEIKAEWLSLFARINAGESGAIVTAGLNGETAGLSGSMTVEEKFIAYGQAIKDFEGSAVPMTYAGFANLQR